MTTLESPLQQEWDTWHRDREEQLRTPHGWLSLTALHWLDGTARAFDGIPGTWRATGDGGVELTADGDAALDGSPVTGTVRLGPVDGQPGVLVEIGDRRVEVIRRTDGYALRMRDPQAITRTAFTGAPAFDVDARWVVEGRFEAYPEPRRLTVGAVVDGLQHFPTAVGVVRFPLDGAEHELVAFPGKAGGLSLHFRDATSGSSTYGGGRSVALPDPDADGRVTIDFNPHAESAVCIHRLRDLPATTGGEPVAGGGGGGGAHPAAARPVGVTVSVEPATMREVLGHFASGIVVVTAAGPDGLLGFTCQSFASLSLDPALVSFSPSRTSSTWPRIRAAGAFCVNVLSAGQQQLSAGFARSGADKFAGVAWSPGPEGAPVLNGACAWIGCTLWREYDGGDHTIVAGRVRDLGADATRSPLLYHRGRYGLATHIEEDR